MFRSLAILVATALFSLSALATEFKCEQDPRFSPVDPNVGLIRVTVTELKNIATATEYRGEYRDSIDLVKVVVTATKDNKTSVLKKVKATASSEDVQYWINDNGINFHLYLDQNDEAGIVLRANGRKIDVSLICNW